MTIRLNVFAGARDKTPRAQDDLEWPEVVAELTALANRAAADKLALLAVTFGELSEPHNVDANYLNHTAIVIDVDSLPGGVDALQVSSAALVYASPSDPNEDGSRRVRIVAPLSRPLLPAEVKHARMAFAESLGIGPGQGVESAMAVSQIMFAGNVDGRPRRDVWEFKGPPLDADALVSAPLLREWRPVKARKDIEPLTRIGVEDPDERTELLLAALEDHWEAPGAVVGRRQILRALGGYLARRGWSDEQVAAVARGLETERPESVRVALMVECARDARSNPAGAAGWNALASWNADAAAVIEACAKDPIEPDGWTACCWTPWWSAYLSRRAARGPLAPLPEDEPPASDETEEPVNIAPVTVGPTPDYDWTSADAPIEWYCKGLGIAPSERKITLIAGDPGSGKGPLAGYLAVCFAFGLKAFGTFECKRCNVGILDFEGARLSARRIRSQTRGFGLAEEDLQGRVFLRDCDPGDFEFLEPWLKEHAIEVLIVDSYMSAMANTDADPNDPEYAALARDLGALGIVVIIIAHARKPAQGKRGERPSLGDVAGSYALGGMAATAIAVWNPNDDDRQVARIGCMRAPDEAFQTFDVRWSKSGTDEKPIWTGAHLGAATKEARDEVKEQTAEQQRDEKLTRAAVHVIACMRSHTGMPKAVNAIAKDTGIQPRDVGAVVGALVRAKMIHEQGSAKSGGSTYVLGGDVPSTVRVERGEIVATAEVRGRFGKKFIGPPKRTDRA